MSAGGSSPTADRSLEHLAPAFQRAVRATIDDCHAEGLDATVFETLRSPELAALYYQRGRPPTDEYPEPVTNAPDASWTWHGYGLATDIISAAKEWAAGDEWFAHMAMIAKRHGLDWGGDWPRKDRPHVQWGKCKASPSLVSRTLYKAGRIEEVWQLVGAL